MANRPNLFEAKAPMRLDPAGGGTDCPPYCIDYGGAVVNIGVALYARATVRRLEQPHEVVIRGLDFDAEVRASSVDELYFDGNLDLLKGFVRRVHPEGSLELTVESEVPPGSGLGSSAAVGVACIAALRAAAGLMPDPLVAAHEANSVERDDLGRAGGSQDSYGAALGGFNFLLYKSGGGVQPRKLNVTGETRRELERRCVLVHTGEAHVSFSIHEDIRASYTQPNSPTIGVMHSLVRLANEAADLLEAGDVEGFGGLLNESWRQLKHLHPSCNSDRLGQFFSAAAPHMVGGKTCGAGGGGCIMFLARQGGRQGLEAACQSLGGTLMPFAIDEKGVTVH